MRKNIRQILAWALTPIFFVVFLSLLVVFHPFVLLSSLFGQRSLARTLWLMSALIDYSLMIVGSKLEFVREFEPASERPIIIVSNHQSFFDIPLLFLLLRNHEPKFITKKELAHWIPSVSFNIRNGGSVIIDRSQNRASIESIKNWGPSIRENCSAAVIFPEGTRARDGVMKKFKVAGLIALIESLPEAEIIPVVIQDSFHLLENKMLPMPFGTHIKLTLCQPIPRPSEITREFVEQIEDFIRNRLGQQVVAESADVKALGGGWI